MGMHSIVLSIVKIAQVDDGNGNGLSDKVSDIASTHDGIIMALIALLATAVGILGYVIRNGIYSKQAAQQATEANKAVNNIGPGEHRLYDRVNAIAVEQKAISKKVDHLTRDQEKFDSHGWETLPPDLNTAVGLTSTIRDIQYEHRIFTQKLDEIHKLLVDHVEWEMKQKYPSGESGPHHGPVG